MQLTLAELETARQEAYAAAEKIQTKLAERLAHVAQNTSYTLNYVEKPTHQFHRIELGAIPWVEARQAADDLRAKGHTVISLYGTADTSTSEDIRRELARAFDIASGIEAVIQQERRAQRRREMAA